VTQTSGTSRPGGRTARTRAAVHAAVRELLAESSPVTIAEVAARSGVHSVTIYRRWSTPAALVLDVAVEDLTDREPVPVTGDLEADLLAYTRQLVASVSRPEGLGLFRALVAAANDPAVGPEQARVLATARLDQFQVLLDAGGTTELSPMDLFELLHAPIYIGAMLAIGPGADRDAAVGRLVDNVIAVRDHRRR
jgi:AcrR family transcriptional regulator